MMAGSTEPIDVVIPTYNAARHLGAAISAVERVVPIRKIIAADHHSVDGTVGILHRHKAVVFFEDRSLGYARQLLTSKAKTRVFMMLDADVVLKGANWFRKAIRLLGSRVEDGRVVGAVALIPNTRPPLALKKYVDFWWSMFPSLERDFFVTHSTLFLKKAVEGLRIPPSLGASEDVFIWLHLRRRGYVSRTMRVDGVHYFEYDSQKGHWMGAGLRTLQGYVGMEALPFILRNICVYPALLVVAALSTRDSDVLLYNLKRWIGYVKGFSNPTRFWQIRRSPGLALGPRK